MFRVSFAWLVILLPAAPATTGTLVVLNKSDATASLIDDASGLVKATLPTQEGPQSASG